MIQNSSSTQRKQNQMSTQGERLEKLRKLKGFSQQALADSIGVSKSSVNKVLSDGGNFEVKNYLKLNEVYGISLDWLILGKGDMFITEKPTQISDELKDVVKTEVITLLNEYGVIDVVK